MDELQRMLSETELEGIPVAILANKQDLPNAMKAEEINRELMSKGSFRGRVWCLFSVCATSGEGLYEALDWLSNMIAHNQAKSYVKKTIIFGHEKEAKDENGNIKNDNLSTLSSLKNMMHSFHKMLYQ